MIRINLYPTKPVKKKEKAGIIDLVVFLLVTLVCTAAIWFINGMISEKIERQQLANDTKQTKIASIKQSIQDHDQIKAQLAEIEAREKIIQELVAARTGPVQMLVELSNIMSAGKGPAIRPDEYQEMLKRDPSSGYNPEWDPRRLWLLGFDEKDREVTLTGEAMSNEDVGEFLRRIKISTYFFDEQLVKTQTRPTGETQTVIIAFEIKCSVRYR